MPNPSIHTGLQLRSLARPEGELELSLVETTFPAPAADEVLVQVQASPINPSDIGNLFGPADLSTMQVGGSLDRPVITATIPAAAMKAIAWRVGESMTVGNEGAGIVVAAGESPGAQALLGRLVAAVGGGMYSQYRLLKADDCLLLPEGTAAADAASCFVNPLTALGMVETMRLEGHRAIVHTAAASNLGQMLNRICLKDGIGLVNLVRKPQQKALLESQGARHVIDASEPGFEAALTDAIAATGATIGFDATGGGRLAGQILGCMEAALVRSSGQSSRYGTRTHKQIYIYGMLDTSPTQFSRSFGMAWSIGGWLLFNFMDRIGPQASARLKQRVVDELTTTFASHYSARVSLAGMLEPQAIAAWYRRETGCKYLVEPHRG
jgi:NADPH:quinone reductase